MKTIDRIRPQANPPPPDLCLPGADADGQRFYPASDTGMVSAGVYLYCASEGLATVALVSVDKRALHRRLGLRADQVITLTQPVGCPATEGEETYAAFQNHPNDRH